MPALDDVTLDDPRPRRDRGHRPLRLRQVHAARGARRPARTRPAAVDGQRAPRRRPDLALAGGLAAAAAGLRVRHRRRQPAARPRPTRATTTLWDALRRVGPRRTRARPARRPRHPARRGRRDAVGRRAGPARAGAGACSPTGRWVLLDEPTAHLDDRHRAGHRRDRPRAGAQPRAWSWSPTGRRWSQPPTGSSTLPGAAGPAVPARRARRRRAAGAAGPRRAAVVAPSARRVSPLPTVLGGLASASGVALTATAGWLIAQASYQPAILTLWSRSSACAPSASPGRCCATPSGCGRHDVVLRLLAAAPGRGVRRRRAAHAGRARPAPRRPARPRSSTTSTRVVDRRAAGPVAGAWVRARRPRSPRRSRRSWRRPSASWSRWPAWPAAPRLRRRPARGRSRRARRRRRARGAVRRRWSRRPRRPASWRCGRPRTARCPVSSSASAELGRSTVAQPRPGWRAAGRWCCWSRASAWRWRRCWHAPAGRRLVVRPGARAAGAAAAGARRGRAGPRRRRRARGPDPRRPSDRLAALCRPGARRRRPGRAGAAGRRPALVLDGVAAGVGRPGGAARPGPRPARPATGSASSGPPAAARARSRRCCCASSTRRAGTVALGGPGAARARPRRRTAHASGWSTTTPTSSPPRWPRTSGWPGPAPTDVEVERRAPRRPGLGRLARRACPTGSTPGSATGTPRSPAASAPGSAIARSLLADQPVLVLDEPTAHLDGATADELAARGARGDGRDRTVVWITHAAAGLDLVDRVVDLDRRGPRTGPATPVQIHGPEWRSPRPDQSVGDIEVVGESDSAARRPAGSRNGPATAPELADLTEQELEPRLRPHRRAT